MSEADAWGGAETVEVTRVVRKTSGVVFRRGLRRGTKNTWKVAWWNHVWIETTCRMEGR